MLKYLLVGLVWLLILAFGVLLAFLFKGEFSVLRSILMCTAVGCGIILTKQLLENER